MFKNKKIKRALKELFKSKREVLVQNIYYHSLRKDNGRGYNYISLKKFEEHLKYIKYHKYKTINFSDLLYPHRNQKCLLISFDDGYENIYKMAFQLMKKYNINFNIFLETGAINNKEGYLTWTQIKQMLKSNLLELGAHTFSHKDARYINERDFYKEFKQSNQIILNETGEVVKDFCFPYGAYNKRVIKKLEQYQYYDRLYTSDGIKIKKSHNLFVIGRVGISNEDSIDDFSEKVKGSYNQYLNIMRKLRILFGREKSEKKRVSL